MLRDLNDKEAIGYWHLSESLRNEINCMVTNGFVEYESTLLLRQEQGYLNIMIKI